LLQDFEFPRSKRVVVGGTFDHFHEGHKLLLTTAFYHAGFYGTLNVGITAQSMLKEKPYAEQIDPYVVRKANVQGFLTRLKTYYKTEIRIEELKDPYGSAITDEELDAIVVTEEPEVKTNVEEINRRRKEPLDVIICPTVFGEDGKRISSTRIRGRKITNGGFTVQ